MIMNLSWLDDFAALAASGHFPLFERSSQPARLIQSGT
jgi:hypothetical protein